MMVEAILQTRSRGWLGVSTVNVTCARWSPVSTVAIRLSITTCTADVVRPGDRRLHALGQAGFLGLQDQAGPHVFKVLERQLPVGHFHRPQHAHDPGFGLFDAFDADQLGADLADRLHRLQGGAGNLILLVLQRD